jgi:hypothetical protein
MTKELTMCVAMLNQFNRDVDRRGYIGVYDAPHFSELGFRFADRGAVESAIFDIDNDGTDELVVRKYWPTDDIGNEFVSEIYVYPKGSTVLETYEQRMPWKEFDFETPNRIVLKEYRLAALPSPSPMLRGRMYVGPFRFNGAIYISLTGVDKRWIVIAKYVGRDSLQDICYFRDTRDTSP